MPLPNSIVGETVHVVTKEGDFETTVEVYASRDRATEVKADWYRLCWGESHSSALPGDDEEAIEHFEDNNDKYRAHINAEQVNA